MIAPRQNKSKTRLSAKKFGVKKITSKRYPRLRAKAAQARHLIPFALELAREYRHTAGGEDRFQMMHHLSLMYDFAAKAELSHDDLMMWRWSSSLFMYYYVSCGYRVYPKFHYLLHIPEHVQRGGSVRSFWVYAEESKNCQLKRLFLQCSKGYNVHKQILLRLLWQSALNRLS